MRETKGLIEATESNLTLGAGRKLIRGALARRILRTRCAVLAAPIAALCTIAVFLPATPASAGEYCRKDVMSQMVSCSFDSLEQCQWTSSGRGGDCFRDPWLPPVSPYTGPRVERAPRKVWPHRAKTAVDHN